MRKILFLLSPRPESSMESSITAYNFSDYSVQGVLLQSSPGLEKTFPFPCYRLDGEKGEKGGTPVYPSIHYPDMLKMIFEADTVISYS